MGCIKSQCDKDDAAVGFCAKKMKRFLAYSCINHIGFILIGFRVGGPKREAERKAVVIMLARHERITLINRIHNAQHDKMGKAPILCAGRD